MGGADANGGCCTLKRGSGIFILVLSILSLVGSIICAVIAGFSEMPLYTAFGWIHFVLLIYLISAASASVLVLAAQFRTLQVPPLAYAKLDRSPRLI